MDILISIKMFIIFVGLIVYANVGHCEEDPWSKREQDAKKAGRLAFNPNPQTVISEFNQQAQRSTKGVVINSNEDRQKHKHNTGRCIATNPIDQCWRCQPNWAKHRQTLADCVLGFGRHTTGGKHGNIYEVTDSSDNNVTHPKPGTLRHAVIQTKPLWIIFRHSMVITLTQELILTSDKTIDGRGAQVHIANGASITLQYVTNVIIHGLHIHDIKATNGGILIRDAVNHVGLRGPSDGDGISIFGSSNIWIDHISMSNCADGLIDAISASTGITISNCHFTRHDKGMLFGAHDSDSDRDDSQMQISVAFNHFGRDLTQRLPRVRFGLAHVVNNDYTQWLMYALGGSENPTIISHGNHFYASDNPNTKEVTKRESEEKREWEKWLWKSEGDVFENGAFFRESGDLEKFTFSRETSPVDGSFARHFTRFAGALKCIPSRPC